jgi:hypothetical protein
VLVNIFAEIRVLLAGLKRAYQRRAASLRGVALALLAMVIFSRSPDVLLRARFFAEDGQVFYQQAHELGFLHSIFLPFAGYFHLVPRLVAGLSLLLPLFYVPLFFNTVALTVQCITVLYICSARLRNMGPLPTRAVVAFLYLGLPHIGEVWGACLPHFDCGSAAEPFWILVRWDCPQHGSIDWAFLYSAAPCCVTGCDLSSYLVGRDSLRNSRDWRGGTSYSPLDDRQTCGI